MGKTYTALAGEPAYNAAMQGLILDGAVDAARLESRRAPQRVYHRAP